MIGFDFATKVWSGPKEDRSGDSLSFRETLLTKLQSTPEKVFQISDDEGTSLTYSEAAVLSIRIAQNLKRFGVQQGDVVAVLAHNSTYLAPIVFGCAMIEAPVNSIMSKQGFDVECMKITFALTKPKVIILEDSENCFQHVMETVKAIGFKYQIFLMNSNERSLCKNVFNFCELLMETFNENNFK